MKKQKCYYCKTEIEDNNIICKEISEKSNKYFHKEEKCFDKYSFEKKNKCLVCKKKVLYDENYIEKNGKYYHNNCFKEKEFQIKEKEELDKVYSFIKEKILQYPKETSLSKNQVKMLKELREGKFLIKNSKQEYCGYTYTDIYYTFVLNQHKILNSLQGKLFDNENIKFAYIMTIIKNNINDIVLKRIKKEETNKNIQKIEIEIDNNISNTYIKKTLNKTNLIKLLDDDRW